MKLLLAISISLLVAPLPSFSGILGPGQYNGVVVFDRWDGCHLYTGVYEMEISESVKESLRPYRGKAVLIDAQEVFQPMNPGDALITKLRVLGPARNTAPPNITRPPVAEGFSLRSIPSFSQQGYDELIVELRNDTSSRRAVDTSAIGPTLLTKRRGLACFNPADGPSFPILTRWSVSFMQQSAQGASCQENGKSAEARVSLAPGFDLSQKFDLDPGQSIEIPIRFELSPGEYEFLAGYGSSYQSPAIASNAIDFDVDDAGKPHLTKSSLPLNLVRPPRRTGETCGKVTLENGNPAPQANVFLWSEPFPKVEPRVANMATTGEDGFFRLEEVPEGRYILSALGRDANGVSVGAFGAARPADGVPLSLPDEPGSCSLLITIHPQITYSVRGRTQAGPGRTASATLVSGDAFPFEATALVQSDGRYEFRNLPAGRYQFFAGWTGSGFDVKANIDDLNIAIKWPDQTLSGTAGPPMPPEFNEAMILSELGTLDQAEHNYAKTYGKGFTRSLDQLGPPPKWYHLTADRAGLFSRLGTTFLSDQDSTHFTEFGYRFTYSAGEPDSAGRISGYTISARPITFGKTGRRSFYMDQTGVVHTRTSDHSATKDDPVVTDVP